MKRRVLFILLPLTLLAGCGGKTVLGGAPNIQVYPGDSLPAPLRTDVSAVTYPNFVGPYDQLSIDVYGIDGMKDRQVRLDEAGTFSFPFAGTLNVNGMTSAEIQTKLAERLKTTIVDPQVTVTVKEYVSKVVTVEGQVKRPGIYPAISRLSLLRTIALAEGTDEFTKEDDVVIFRKVNGQQLAALYDLNAIRHGQYPDPEVYPNDVIVVGESHARRLFKDILTALPALTTPIIYALDRAN